MISENRTVLRLLFFITFLLPLTAMAIEEPKYDVLEKSGVVELRQYSTVIIAEVMVEGNMDEASSKGFRLIADFIFGNNRGKSGGSEKISMTAPVTVEPKPEKIAMTAPVTLQPHLGKWRVNFVMPSQYTVESLPSPNNPQVVIRELPSRKVAVISFSGLAGESKVSSKTAELLAWINSKRLKPLSTPELARYNPPWTLPFLRRNEVIVEYE